MRAVGGARRGLAEGTRLGRAMGRDRRAQRRRVQSCCAAAPKKSASMARTAAAGDPLQRRSTAARARRRSSGFLDPSPDVGDVGARCVGVGAASALRMAAACGLLDVIDALHHAGRGPTSAPPIAWPGSPRCTTRRGGSRARVNILPCQVVSADGLVSEGSVPACLRREPRGGFWAASSARRAEGRRGRDGGRPPCPLSEACELK